LGFRAAFCKQIIFTILIAVLLVFLCASAFTLMVAVTNAMVDVDVSLISELPYGWERVDDPHYGVYYIEYVISKCFRVNICYLLIS